MHLDISHVDSVHIAPLLLVYLDVDEVVIHELGSGLIFKALPLHYVAPVMVHNGIICTSIIRAFCADQRQALYIAVLDLYQRKSWLTSGMWHILQKGKWACLVSEPSRKLPLPKDTSPPGACDGNGDGKEEGSKAPGTCQDFGT